MVFHSQTHTNIGKISYIPSTTGGVAKDPQLNGSELLPQKHSQGSEGP